MMRGDIHSVDLDPAREFPADSAAGEGFTNTGNALVMSPALVTTAARRRSAIAIACRTTSDTRVRGAAFMRVDQRAKARCPTVAPRFEAVKKSECHVGWTS